MQPEEDVTGLTPVGKEIPKGWSTVQGNYSSQIYQNNFGRTDCQTVIAPLPDILLKKSIAEASLLSHLLIGRYVDHLPIYRQLEIFKRPNVDINHSTVSGWISQSMELIKPVYDLHCKEVLNSNYLCVDETTVVRKDPTLLLFYKQLLPRMDPNKAIVKVARKLLNRLRCVLINEKEYVSGILSWKKYLLRLNKGI